MGDRPSLDEQGVQRVDADGKLMTVPIRTHSARFSWLAGPDDFAVEWGNRWARYLREEIGTLGRWADRIGENFYAQVEKLADVPKVERVKETMALVKWLQEREATEAKEAVHV